MAAAVDVAEVVVAALVEGEAAEEVAVPSVVVAAHAVLVVVAAHAVLVVVAGGASVEAARGEISAVLRHSADHKRPLTDLLPHFPADR